MAKNYQDSIDVTVFAALKVAELSSRVLKSPLQPLLLSGPGMGKSTAVQLFGEIEGYEVVMLRGNSTSPEVVQGFDVAPTNTETTHSTKHLRPTWFQTVLDNHAAGKKTLLFLDEISTANEYVQGSLLYLILERKCDQEPLPEDTLVIAAANYSNNLSNTMVMLPPLLNRFMIVNIIPTKKDIPHFLSKFSGALTGKREDFKVEIKKQMTKLNEMAIKDPSPEFIGKVGELIEQAIQDIAYQLCSDKTLDLGVSDLKDIYSDVEGKDALPGFITMRTLNFARDTAIASYLAFGKSGLSTTNSNFRNMMFGLIGVALSYDNKMDVKKSVVVDQFLKALEDVSNDIEKMNNSKLPEYQAFFSDILKKKGDTLSVADMNLISNKIEEMLKDSEISTIDRPIDAPVIKELITKILASLKSNTIASSSSDMTAITEKVAANPEEYTEHVNTWNQILTLVKSVGGVVKNTNKKYSQDVKEQVTELELKCREASYPLKLVRKILIKKDPAIEQIIPQINML